MGVCRLVLILAQGNDNNGTIERCKTPAEFYAPVLGSRRLLGFVQHAHRPQSDSALPVLLKMARTNTRAKDVRLDTVLGTYIGLTG